MCKISKSLCCIVLCTASLSSAQTLRADVREGLNLSINPIPVDRPTHAHNEILVRFKPGVNAAEANHMAAQYTSHTHKRLGKNREFHLLRLRTGQTVEEAMAQLKSDPNVELVEPNYLVYAAAVPDDTHYGNLWGLKNTGQTVNLTVGTTGADIDAESAWDHITNCSTAIVAVIDTGIHYNHGDLAGNIWINTVENTGTTGVDDDGNGKIDDIRGWDFVNDDNNPIPNAAHESHGTHVAGTIGAVGNNGKGVTGVCWQARIMPLRVLDETGSGTTANVALAINYAVANGAKVINMSLGTTGNSAAVQTAITNALANGVVVIAAAGNTTNNNDATPVYPCSYTDANVICVAALDQNHSRASFSNFGLTSVDLGAPGTNTYSNYTGRLIVDTLTGWTKTGAWTETSCVFTSGTFNVLVNPVNYCSGGPYTNNANDVAYKVFNVSGVLSATLVSNILHNFETNFDFVRIRVDSTGADPSTGTIIGTITGDSGSNGNIGKTYDTPLGACLTTTCAVGLQLTTDASVTSRGIGVVSLTVETLETTPEVNAYGFKRGTSMATPHVSGVAAMLRAFNPNFTYLDTVNALRDSGDPQSSLNGVTVSGRSLNAMSALRYVNAPRGVSAAVVP